MVRAGVGGPFVDRIVGLLPNEPAAWKVAMVLSVGCCQCHGAWWATGRIAVLSLVRGFWTCSGISVRPGCKAKVAAELVIKRLGILGNCSKILVIPGLYHERSVPFSTTSVPSVEQLYKSAKR